MYPWLIKQYYLLNLYLFWKYQNCHDYWDVLCFEKWKSKPSRKGISAWNDLRKMTPSCIRIKRTEAYQYRSKQSETLRVGHTFCCSLDSIEPILLLVRTRFLGRTSMYDRILKPKANNKLRIRAFIHSFG